MNDFKLKEFNALLTGSQKYGHPSPESDIDVVVWVTPQTLDTMWREFEDDSRIVFNQVKFVEDSLEEFVIGFDADDGVDIHCRMCEADQDILAGLHHHRKDGKVFRSTGRNNNVNIIPVCDPDRWSIWVDGTDALYQSRLTGDVHEITTREDAINFFTLLGMPRINS